MSKKNINISLEQFQAALVKYRAEGRATEAEAELVEWLWGYAHGELEGDPDAVADLLGMDWTTIYRVWRGTYPAGLTNFSEQVANLKRRLAEGRVTEFGKTPVTERIWEALDYARDYSAAVLVCGPTGASKTATLLEWAKQNNHGRSVYVRIPSSCTRAKLVRRIAKAMGMSTRRKDTTAMEDSIHKAMNRRKILILDEGAHTLKDSRKAGEPLLEFARDLFDEEHCAVVIVLTHSSWGAMTHGAQADILEQWVGRISHRVIIPPDKVFKVEVEQMIRLYGGVEPTPEIYKLCAAVAKSNEGRLRTLCEDLRQAASVAREEGVELTALHLRLARALRERGGSWDDEEVA
ncbi:MAG: AAA family ATPase [Victivallales bacterium]|jgi:hypothetical protein|nr:AAA family ATPase [Victivallales bacterium]